MMKKLFIIIASLFSLTLVGSGFADIAPGEGEHTLTRCIKISNPYKNNYTVYQLVRGPMIKKSEITKITENTCLNKGYKFNSIQVYLIKNAYIKKIKSVKNIPTSGDATLKESSYVNKLGDEDLFGSLYTTVSDTDTLIAAENICYKIAIKKGKKSTAIASYYLKETKKTQTTIQK